MKKIFKTMAVWLLTLTVVFTAGCKKDSAEPNSGGDNGGSTPTTEGIYLGVIGFNQHFTNKEISLLNSSTLTSFQSFIDQLSMENGTGLYYADYTALNKLKSYPKPPKLNNVALVTFTDGLDNVSLGSSETNPENYSSTSAYRTALNNKINSETIHGKNVTAYTIGIKGSDVFDDDEFHNNLNMLASSPDNVFEVTDMNEALQRFAEIAESLHSVTSSSTLKLQLPGGYDNGVKIRLSFDNVSSAENSTQYIECTYKWTDNGRRLESITYHGFNNGSTTLNSVAQTGLYYEFEFKDLSYTNGNVVSQSDLQHLKLWRQISSGAWQPDVEFTPANSSQVTEEQSSALIMLVLDCTTSLGSQFNNMKAGAKRFVETLVTSTGGGGGNIANLPTVRTSNVTSITNNSAICGGTVTNDGGSNVTDRGICWSTNSNPTCENNYVSLGMGVADFSATMSNLISNTTYYVRAYARNSVGISYGNQESFTTTSGGGGNGNNIYMCDGSTFVTSGTTYYFYDSGGPDNDYSNNEYYTYTFRCGSGYRVKIEFNSFATESGGYDYIQIGSTGSSYSGTFIPGPFYSPGYGQDLTIRFYSDESVTHSGWSATVTAVE